MNTQARLFSLPPLSEGLRQLTRAVAVALAASAASLAHAQATIDQTKALAGNVTPGDTAGFPITISQPGSYKLMSNLYVPANTAGIKVAADNVSIDLNGFSVIGPITCSRDSSTLNVTCPKSNAPSVFGIDGTDNRSVSVRNGAVQGFAGGGIALSDGLVDGARVQHNGLYGVYIGTHGVITNSVAEYNETGFYAYFGSIVNCSAGYNGKGFDGSAFQTVITNSSARVNAIGFAGGALHGVTAYGNTVNVPTSGSYVKSMGNNLVGGALF